MESSALHGVIWHRLCMSKESWTRLVETAKACSFLTCAVLFCRLLGSLEKGW